jgi:alpha-mannosidase
VPLPRVASEDEGRVAESASSRKACSSIGDLKLNDFAAKSDDGEPLRVENHGPVSVTVRARSQAGLAHTTAITLYRGSDRVDIRNELNANFSDVRHWAFSFALNEPAVHSEEVGTVNLNQFKSAGGDYADTHARYDYITVNHFADITDGAGTKGVTISNPDLAFARLGNSTVTSLDTQTPQLHLLAGGQVDGPSLGIPAQNGNTHFLQRFALRPHGSYEQTAAMKFALEHQNPFVFPHQSVLRLLGPVRGFAEIVRPELDACFGRCFERLYRASLSRLYLREGVRAHTLQELYDLDEVG